MLKANRLLLATTLILIVSSCKTTDWVHQKDKVDNRSEAGTVLLSVNSTIPWHEVSEDLDPSFVLKDGDQALDKVVQTTADIQSQILKSFGAGLSIGLPRSYESSLVNSVTTQTDSGIPSTTFTKTEKKEKKQGEADDLFIPSPPSRLTGDSPISTSPSNLGIDPFLQYKSAQSLYHSIKLLNQEARNAAVREGYVPHIVMLKLTNIAYRRNLPYDVHASVSFFFDSAQEADIKSAYDSSNLKPFRMPYVIPILATDNIEKAITNRAAEIAKQLGISINAMISGAGIGAGANNSEQQLEAIAANDFNSLLTVGRVSDNGLYIRIGAANQSTTRHALIGKTYDIAALVLVPKEYYTTKGEQAGLSIISHSEFRDTESGEVLPNTPSESYLLRIEDAFRSVLGSDARGNWANLNSENKLEIARTLTKNAQINNWNGFKKDASNLTLGASNLGAIGSSSLKTLWTRLSAISADSSYKSASVKVRASSPVKISKQSAILRDFGNSGSQIVLRGVSGYSPGAILAHVEFKSGAVFPTLSTTFNSKEHTLSLNFSSLKKFNIDPSDAVLKIEEPDCVWGNACANNEIQSELPIFHLPIEVKTPAPSFKIRQTIDVILADKGTGGLSIYLEDLKDDHVYLTLESARILEAKESSTGNSIPINNQKLTFSKATGIDLKLDNLQVGKTVKVIAEGRKEDQSKGILVSTGKKSLEFSIVKSQ